jgi:hypothetical protein
MKLLFSPLARSSASEVTLEFGGADLGSNSLRSRIRYSRNTMTDDIQHGGSPWLIYR